MGEAVATTKSSVVAADCIAAAMTSALEADVRVGANILRAVVRRMQGVPREVCLLPHNFAATWYA
jgi:hypothetical protein